MDEPLRFQRISSSVSITFWDRLKFLKINEYRLDQSPVPLVGFYSAPASSSISAGISLDHSSFGYVNGGAGENELISCGEIHNVNTIDEFKSIDWKGKVESAALKLKNDIFSGKAIHVSIFIQIYSFLIH